MKQKKESLIFVIYDGLQNSVFSSQVLSPLLNLINNNNLDIYLVSFEKKIEPEKILKIFPAHENLHLIISRKFSFCGKSSLIPAIYQFKKILKLINPDKIIARGPLAGFIAIKANKQLKINLIIQARGLCAQEYRYTKKNNFSLIKKLFYFFIYKSLEKIEKIVFRNKNIIIETVSPALKTYLIENFKAQENNILIAQKDIPQKINTEQVNYWRKELRTKLNIPENYYVYCYSGAFKPWQAVPEILDFFKKEQEQNINAFLLILSQDKEIFENLIKESKISQNKYLILNIKPEEVYKYLAICDAGLLFREKDIINWVSRPTKMLEYQSVGLKIIHNNTIGYLSENQI